MSWRCVCKALGPCGCGEIGGVAWHAPAVDQIYGVVMCSTGSPVLPVLKKALPATTAAAD